MYFFFRILVHFRGEHKVGNSVEARRVSYARVENLTLSDYPLINDNVYRTCATFIALLRLTEDQTLF